ncbi:MAG: hypothetical protein GF408_02640 [Candidatus Omnitrophica bacterium]|nr:hypothetical protein [Candidatus Omnitrophota bacterium]
MTGNSGERSNMDEKTLKRLENKLKKIHDDLGRQMQILGKEIRQEMPQDSEDALSAREEADVLEQEDLIEEVEIREVEEALQRIGDGSYGRCLDCGEEIKIERLKALPYAKYCVKCKEEREKE